MTIHAPHPDTHTHGLHDGCPRCTEHAEHPILSLDEKNLTRMMAGALASDPSLYLHSHLDALASAKVLTGLEHAGHLARTAPSIFFTFLRRYGVYAEPFTPEAL